MMNPAPVAMLALLSGMFSADVRFTYPEWRYKALTFSYDDAGTADRKLAALLNRYRLKATFNVSSGRLDRPPFLDSSELAGLYRGHEVAGHGMLHRRVPDLTREEQFAEVFQDRVALERLTGQEVRGFAWPYGKHSPEAREQLRKAGIVYARAGTATGKFTLPDDFLHWEPTAHHRDGLLETGRRYLAYRPWGGVLSCCFIWGHSYELERDAFWPVMEEFCAMLADRPDIWYATNLEIVDYLNACRALESSVDGNILRNRSALTLYLVVNGRKVKLNPGETWFQDKNGDGAVVPPVEEEPLVHMPAGAVTDRTVFFPDGSRKALTFCFDDNMPQDERLTSLLKRHGMRGTFQLIGNTILEHPERLAWYQEHEVAAHGLRHVTYSVTTNAEILNDIVAGRKILETLCGKIVTGHAWPNGSGFGAPAAARQILSMAGITYARGTACTGTFAPPRDFMLWEPTVKATDRKLEEVGQAFLEAGEEGDLQICMVWGHSWELKSEEDWGRLERFCGDLSRAKVWKSTCGEICDYLRTVRELQWSADRSFVRNPGARTVLIGCGGKVRTLRAGETLRFPVADEEKTTRKQ